MSPRAWTRAMGLAALVAAANANAQTGTPGVGAGPGSGPGPGSGLGSGSGSGPGPGSGSGSDAGAPVVIQLPTDVAAPQVNASASPTALRLGDRFTLVITATFGPGVEVNLREPLDLGPAFEVRKKLSADRPHADGTRTREWQLDVVAWDLGDLRIAPIAVTFTVGGRAGQVETNAVRVRVDGVLGDIVDAPDAALRDLQPPTALVARDWFWLWAVLPVALVLAGFAGYRAWRRRRRRRVARLFGGAVAAPARLDMTSERALEALLAIGASGVLDHDAERKRGYTQMVAVVRDYLAARFGVATSDLTSSELVRRLRAVATAHDAAAIEAWLARCDLVKYGGVLAPSAEARVVLDDARALIVATTARRDRARTEAA